MKLADALFRATVPSDQPDDKHTPAEWTKRLYYLALRAGYTSNMLGRINWNASASNLTTELAFNSPMQGRFEALEKTVAEMLTERYGS